MEPLGLLDRFRLHLGDVALARRGELGRCAVVREEPSGWVRGNGCFVLRLDTQRAIAEMMTRLDHHARLLCKQLELAQEIRHEALHRLVAS